MKISLTLVFVCLCSLAFSQPRRISFRTLARDSINLHLDENYALIEDTCSSIIRYGHFRLTDRKFFGTFRDLNKYDPSIVLAEGRYTNDGKLDGPIILNYLNGDPQAEGVFNNGKMIGKWVVYYTGNKKRLEFEESSGKIKVLNAWEASGKQTVINGNGTYKSDLGVIYWEGKLLDGTPDGLWRAKKTDDRSGTVVSSETFKNGTFVKGSSPIGNYNDASRIILASESLLPISNAVAMIPSNKACDPSNSFRKIVYAIYKDGKDAFSVLLRNEIVPVFAKVDLRMYASKTFVIKATIDHKGKFTNLTYLDGWEDRQASALLSALYRLPFMEPALVDGKPIPSDVLFTFKINNAVYTYSWQLQPITNK